MKYTSPELIFGTPLVASQTGLLITEKRKITRNEIIEVLGCKNKDDRHKVFSKIAKMKKAGLVTEEDGVLFYHGSSSEKKKSDAVWDALRSKPSITFSEIQCYSSASRTLIARLLACYIEKGFVRVIGYHQPSGTTSLIYRQKLYCLLNKDSRRPKCTV